MIEKIFKKANPRKIKETLCSIMAFLIFLDSMANRLGDIAVRNGKGMAFWYFFIWLWAFYYVLSSNSEEIAALKLENKLLKQRIENYESSKEQHELF